jgi:hypothetical protein
MYGLVNVGIRELVVRSYGVETWRRVLDQSGAKDFVRFRARKAA